MENATKALLIAAAVLIAIVLIALGVNLLSAGGDTADKAGQVGTEISGGIESAKDMLIGTLENIEGRIITKNDFVVFYNKFGKTPSTFPEGGAKVIGYENSQDLIPTAITLGQYLSELKQGKSVSNFKKVSYHVDKNYQNINNYYIMGVYDPNTNIYYYAIARLESQ